jgi:hypothetical protein
MVRQSSWSLLLLLGGLGAVACGPETAGQPGGLSLRFATRSLEGPCNEQPLAAPAPPALARLDIWLFAPDGRLHHQAGGGLQDGRAPAFGGIPEGRGLRLEVQGRTAAGAAWLGGAEGVDIREGLATHADVLMTPAGDLACVTRPLVRPRAFAASAPLGDDLALLAGGATEALADACGPGCHLWRASRSVERFHPGVGAMLPAAPMRSARMLASATPLPDGSVLVVGGVSRMRVRPGQVYPFGIEPEDLVPSYEVYLAAEDIWIEKPLPAGDGRVFHSALALPDGRVLVTGGGTRLDQARDDALLFDPGAESVGEFIRLSDRLATPRLGHFSIWKGDRALLLGGALLTTKSPVEEFIPSAQGGTFSEVSTSGQSVNLFFAAGAVLPGRPDEVLLAGGTFYNGQDGLAMPVAGSPVLYSAIHRTGTQTGSLARPHLMPGMLALGDGRVLLAGGFSDLAATPSADLELFDPLTDRFEQPVGPSGDVSLSVARAGAALIGLPGGRALLAGGLGPQGLLGSAEVFSPSAQAR